MKQSGYIAWAKKHAAARYNLANSGILGCARSDLQLSLEDLELNGANAEGYEPLKQAIAAKYGASPEQVVLAQGTSMANFLACATLLEPGDEVLLEQPAYEPLLAVARNLGAEVKRFTRALEAGYRLDLEQLRRLVSPRTRLIILTSPHNPSGVAVEPAALAALGEMAAQAGARVLVDEVYRDILFESAPLSAVHAGPHFIATSSLTKSYGLSGLRCGWILAAPELAERMRRLHDILGAVGPMPSEKISWLAFRQLPALEARTRALLEPNHLLVRAFLEENADFLEWSLPPRSMVVFPRLRRETSSDSLHDRLRKQDTSIVPGRFFESPRHFRLGFAVQTEDVAEGLRRLSAGLRENP